MIDRMTAVAAGKGLTFRFDRVKPTNTFDAHRVLHLSRERSVQGDVKERLLRAYFTKGEAISDPETLARLSGEAGLHADESAACSPPTGTPVPCARTRTRHASSASMRSRSRSSS